MPNIKVTNVDKLDLDDVLDPDERLLWSGRPGYGRSFLQAVGDERTIHIALLVGALVMFSTLFLMNAESRISRAEAAWVCGAVTLAFLACSFVLASQRQYVLYNLSYFVTDKRAIICRRGQNWRLAGRLYIVSCPHSGTYPYALIASRPYPSVQIGTLLSADLVQPFGLGLSHPGHAILRDRINAEITFDYLPDAQAVLEIIQSFSRNSD
jgi:hypothetical protein